MHFVGLKKFCNYKMAVLKVSPQIQPPMKIAKLWAAVIAMSEFLDALDDAGVADADTRCVSFAFFIMRRGFPLLPAPASVPKC